MGNIRGESGSIIDRHDVSILARHTNAKTSLFSGSPAGQVASAPCAYWEVYSVSTVEIVEGDSGSDNLPLRLITPLSAVSTARHRPH
jgi:hypothetical protein